MRYIKYSRTLYGPLKDEFQPTSRNVRRQATVSFSSATVGPTASGPPGEQRPDVLPASPPQDTPDAADDRPWAERVTVRRKDSVARMTWDGISYVVTVSTSAFYLLSAIQGQTIHELGVRAFHWI